jgi:DNA-binding NtrC family response regulator
MWIKRDKTNMKGEVSILVVNDNEDLSDAFTLILKRKGYTVDTAENGLQASEKFKTRPCDVVLMDAITPYKDCIEALHKMQKNNPETKIILMAAPCEDQQIQKILYEGAYSALFKPVNIARLMELIAAS